FHFSLHSLQPLRELGGTFGGAGALVGGLVDLHLVACFRDCLDFGGGQQSVDGKRKNPCGGGPFPCLRKDGVARFLQRPHSVGVARKNHAEITFHSSSLRSPTSDTRNSRPTHRQVQSEVAS